MQSMGVKMTRLTNSRGEPGGLSKRPCTPRVCMPWRCSLQCRRWLPPTCSCDLASAVVLLPPPPTNLPLLRMLLRMLLRLLRMLLRMLLRLLRMLLRMLLDSCPNLSMFPTPALQASALS